MAGLLVNSRAGFALARLRWKGRWLVMAVIFALIIIPFETIAIPPAVARQCGKVCGYGGATLRDCLKTHTLKIF